MRASMVLISLIFLFSSFNAEAWTMRGPRKAVGRGYAYSWIQYDSHSRPLAIGVSLTKNALDGLPSPDMREYELALPRRLPPYDHVTMDWNPKGHEPAHVYDLPHFDFHFHFLPRGIVHHISCAGPDLARCESHPTGGLVPRDYVPIPGGVPRMGAHWFDPFSPEFHGQIFTATFIHGSYDGRMSFLEPMVTRDFLLSRPSFMSMVKEAQQVDRSGYYPEHYLVTYSPSAQTYVVALVDLHYRNR